MKDFRISPIFYNGFEKFTYFACGKGVADTKEVFISNYKRRGK